LLQYLLAKENKPKMRTGKLFFVSPIVLNCNEHKETQPHFLMYTPRSASQRTEPDTCYLELII
jgi:hypothetical protein